jgi:hypothetical protein
MQKFLLLIRQDLMARGAQTHEDFVRDARLVGQWIEEMVKTGNFLDASALHNKGKYVGRGYINSDGPFIESKECISGFILIQATDLQDAARLAQACPLVANQVVVIEVRELQHIPEASR